MASLQLLAIKPKTWRDLVSDEEFKREEIITIQDPSNLKSRDLREYDYVKNEKSLTGGLHMTINTDPSDADRENDPLKGINVDAAGGASKVLKMIAEKVSFEDHLSEADSADTVREPLAITCAVVKSRRQAQGGCRC